jgi:uncharacterized membrane protein YhaH (DUF805 family)
MNGYITAMQRYFEFSGRSSRSEFWLYMLIYIIIYIVASVIDAFVFGAYQGGGIPILTSIVGLVHIIPSLAVSVRRLHDTDRRGWWIFIALIPLIGTIWLIILYCLPSTPSENRFGAPNPLA